MKMLLCPSMMCADWSNLESEVKALSQANIDIFHCDVMDGNFVPNMALGLEDIKAIRRLTTRPVDVHLMIENPSEKIDWFVDLGVDIIYIHPESEKYPSKVLSYIRNKGIAPGIAINPDTSISMIEELLPYVDYCLVMTVYPGFAGQQFLKNVEMKITRLIQYKKDMEFKVIVDGSCSPPVIDELTQRGVDGFVLGTSALFGKEESYQELVENLRTRVKYMKTE